MLKAWPQHGPFLAQHFDNRQPQDADFIDRLANDVLALAGNQLEQYASDYRWMCSMFLKHELQYRRTGQLSYADTNEIRARYYDNATSMSRYMHGLLISQVTWPQHLGMQLVFKQHFLPNLPNSFDYLEVGPGHGINLAIAGADPRCGSLSGFDISEASITLTRNAIARLGVERPVELKLQDICEAPQGDARYDAICISQVLELVSSPRAAINHLASKLAPGGVLFLNAPVEMRAPDHLRVWADGAELDALLVEAGLAVIGSYKEHADRFNIEKPRQGYSYIALAHKSEAR